MTVALAPTAALWRLRTRRLRQGLVAAAALLAGPVVAVAVTAAVAVLLLGRLPTARESALVGPGLAGAALGALVVGPVRRRGERAVARRRHGAGRSPEEVLQTLGDRASRGVPLEELLLQLAEQLRRAMGLAHVEVWTGDGRALERILSVPHRPGERPALRGDGLAALGRTAVAGPAWLRMWLPELLEARGGGEVRLTTARHGGSTLGVVLVERAPGAERFGERDEQVLADVGRRLGVLLHNRTLDAALQSVLDDLRQANDDLRASRTRLAATADRERRRIERDLHDGAQQHLVALAINLGLAADLVEEDPAAAVELLEQCRVDVKETVQQLRDLAHGIYPALLTDAGLGPALQAAAGRFPSPVALELRALSDGGRLTDAQTDAALYFCVLEALQNAAKHAPGATVRVRAQRVDTALVLEVSDDGPGFDDSAATDGQGLQNMTDRLGAVGGSVGWRRAPGAGTVVSLSVPLPVPMPAALPPPRAPLPPLSVPSPGT